MRVYTRELAKSDREKMTDVRFYFNDRVYCGSIDEEIRNYCRRDAHESYQLWSEPLSKYYYVCGKNIIKYSLRVHDIEYWNLLYTDMILRALFK